MRPLLLSISAIFIALALASSVPMGAVAQEANGPVPESWTFMAYMSGDSSLSGQVSSDLQEMMRVGSGNGLNVIVLADRAEMGDSTLHRVMPGTLEDYPLSAVNGTWGNELNMGDPGVLSQFVIWAANEYPADRYMLDLWGHGNGWPGTCPDKGDFLEMPELRYAMEAISGSGIELDIISMDACQMGMLEVAYELRGMADYALLSQKDVPLNGWPYDIFLEHLMSGEPPSDIGRMMVDSYIAWGKSGNSLYSLTLSLIDLHRISHVASALDDYSREAALMAGYFNPEFIAARTMTENYDGNAQYDLVHLLRNIDNATGCKILGGLSARVQLAMAGCVVHEDKWTNPLDEPAHNAHGLSIWFPSHGPAYDYLGTGFARDTAWPEFLKAMAGHFQQPGRIHMPNYVTAMPMDSDGDGLHDSIAITYAQREGGITTVYVHGPDGELFFEDSLDTQSAGTLVIPLDSVGYYETAVYLRNESGVLLNHSLTIGLARERLGTISGRVTSNTGRGLAWVEVSLRDANEEIVALAFTDNNGHYRMEIVVPRDTDGTGLELVCGMGSGRRNITIENLEEHLTADFSMDISSAYIPWAVKAVGVLNLAGIMAIIYWVAWGKEKKEKTPPEAENLLDPKTITSQCDSMQTSTSTDDIPPPQATT